MADQSLTAVPRTEGPPWSNTRRSRKPYFTRWTLTEALNTVNSKPCNPRKAEKEFQTILSRQSLSPCISGIPRVHVGYSIWSNPEAPGPRCLWQLSLRLQLLELFYLLRRQLIAAVFLSCGWWTGFSLRWPMGGFELRAQRVWG